MSSPTKSNSELTPSPLPASVVEGERGNEVRDPTPGPWTNQKYSTFVWSKDGNVCACGDPHARTTVGYSEANVGSPGLREAVANARLIAAAPDMYMQHCANAAVLEYLVNAIDANKPLTVEMFDKIVACHKRSQSALAKVRGV